MRWSWGPTTRCNHNPLHPYTKALMSAVPIPDPDLEKTKTIQLLGRRITLAD
ncbi:hypothetical protein LN650_12865 [Klebsiella pneumoniae subsp. pneumoniae]|nr:hypothetical protein [Klebsiella pneumoniae subsp. pneumoniae]